MNRSSPDLFRRTRDESFSIKYLSDLDILSHSGDIRDQSRKLAKIAPDFANFLPQFLGDTPEFLDLHYKAHPYIDHVAKFHGDQPTELGDLLAN